MTLRFCVLAVALVALCLTGCHTTSRSGYCCPSQPVVASCPAPCPNGVVAPPPGYVR